MFTYYLRLAWHSIRKNAVISTLMVLALGLGVGSFMVTMTVYYYAASDPIPTKSDRLFAIQLDSWPLEDDDVIQSAKEIPAGMTYLDAKNLMEADLPSVSKVLHYRFGTLVVPENKDIDYFGADVRATNRDFFSMFDLAFQFGGPWSELDDDGKQVVVLTKEINDKLFDGEDSVGRNIKTNDGVLTVVGVLEKVDLAVPYYEPYPYIGSQFAEVFAPINTFINKEPFSFSGSMSCWKPFDGGDHQEFLNSECAWVGFWVQLESATDRPALIESLNNYTDSQKLLGRFERPTNNFAHNVNEWMIMHEVADGSVRLMQSMSFLFLIVCLINTIGLLAAKFSGKASDISVRRALGASKVDIFKQNMLEVSLIGLTGGLVGLIVAMFGLKGMSKLFGETLERMVSLDVSLIAFGITTAIIASIIAGIYPCWRTASEPPAANLKTQ